MNLIVQRQAPDECDQSGYHPVLTGTVDAARDY
jgi:hypothetical protein